MVPFWNILGAGPVSPIGPFPYIHVSDFCPYQNRIWHSTKTENGGPPKLQNWVQLCSRFRINWHPQIAQARVPKPPSGGYRNRKSGCTETARREVPGRPHGKFQNGTKNGASLAHCKFPSGTRHGAGPGPCGFQKWPFWWLPWRGGVSPALRGHAAPTALCQRQNREDRAGTPCSRRTILATQGWFKILSAERNGQKSKSGRLPLQIASPGLSVSPIDAPR